ncbi:MAG: hypothetical protein KDD65_14815 [Bacteroidetes bacterium]|nr:hypothetical protein [Bacteroidota bacterium]
MKLIKRTGSGLTLPLMLVLALAASATGCVTTSVAPLNNKTYAPINPSDVVVYLEEDDIPGDYEKVALLYSRGDYAWTDEARLFKKARKKAAKIGANGLLVQRIKEPNTGDKVAHALIGTEAKRRGEMVAIYVKRPRGTGGVGK